MNTPAFQFYPQDFLVGTMTLSAEAVGVYIKTLCHLWTTGGDDCELEFDPKKLCKIVALSPKKFQKVFSEIEGKFTFFEKNEKKNEKIIKKFFFNERLKNIKNEQNEYREAKSKAGKKGNEKRWGKPKEEKIKTKNEVSHSDSTATDLRIANPIAKNRPSPSSSKKINKLGKFLKDLKKQIGIENFNDSRSYQEDYAKHFVEMIDDIGKEEFETRLKRILERPKKAEQCNKINFVYREIKNYVATEQDQQKAKSAESRKRIEAERKAKLDEENIQKKKDEAVKKWIDDHPKEFEIRLKKAVEEVKYGGTISSKTALAKAKIKKEIAKEIGL